MGTHLDRARAHFGRDGSGFLEGGRYALVHTRSLEFDDLRPYVPGDDEASRAGRIVILNKIDGLGCFRASGARLTTDLELVRTRGI